MSWNNMFVERSLGLANKKLKAENKKMLEALKEIRNMGSVCSEFELCNHPPCADSAGACLTAINVLTELGIKD